jgi:hypothetical protein
MPMRAILTAMLVVLVGPGSIPQVRGQDTRHYKVEMILFSPRGGPTAQGEQFDDEPGLPELDRAVELNSRPAPEGFHALPLAAANLAGVKSRLQSSGRYRVIAHKLWQQPGLDLAAAVPVRVRGGIDYSARFPQGRAVEYVQGPRGLPMGVEAGALNEVDGTVTIVRGRYLHVYTDLVYRTPMTNPGVDPQGPHALGPSLANIRVQGQRRMRSRELHYLDHPLLGILVQITPLEAPPTPATGPAAPVPEASAPAPSPR